MDGVRRCLALIHMRVRVLFDSGSYLTLGPVRAWIHQSLNQPINHMYILDY